MWPIPFSIFRPKAELAMAAAGCPIKMAIFEAVAGNYGKNFDHELVAKEIADRHRTSTLPVKSFFSNLKNGGGEKPFAAMIWYDLHCHPNWKRKAEEIDRKAFGGQTFEEAFANECEPHLVAFGQWRLVGDGPSQATNEFRWNFDLPDRQPGADGKSIAVYLEAAAGLEEVGDNIFGFRKLHIKPQLSGSAADIEISQLLRTPQAVGKQAEIGLSGSGRFASFWTIVSTATVPLEGFFGTEQPVMTIDPTSEPLAFKVQMIAEARDVSDQFGNEQPRDMKDAFLQALFAKEIGERNKQTDSIVLFEMKYSMRRNSKASG